MVVDKIQHTVTLTADTDDAMAMIVSLQDDLRNAAPRDFIDAFLRVLESGDKLFALNVNKDVPAAAGTIRLRFGPTDLLRRVVATCRARDFDLSIFDDEIGSSVDVKDRRKADQGAPPRLASVCGASHEFAESVAPREGLCAFDADAMNEIEGRG